MRTGKKKYNFPNHYLAGLSKANTIKQKKYLIKAKESYKKGVYIPRPKLASFKAKKSRHIVDFERLYDTKITDFKKVAEVTGVPVGALKKIVKKGMGAYYSSGSRPNQSAHSWGYARLGSVLLKRNSYRIDKHVLDEYGVKDIKSPKKNRRRKIGGSKKIIDCCKSVKNTRVCERKADKKLFTIANRRFTKERCVRGPVRGFTMRSSCAPWKNC